MYLSLPPSLPPPLPPAPSLPHSPPSLPRRCASLHYLSLAYCLHFTSKGLRSIQSGRGCRRLVYLDLSGCSQLTAEGMQHVGAGCPILNTLLLDDIPSITDAMMLVRGGARCLDVAYTWLLSQTCFHFCSACPPLPFLTFPPLFLSLPSLSPSSLSIPSFLFLPCLSLPLPLPQKLIKSCKTLRHLSLLGSSRLSDTCFKHTARENRKLRSIKIESE